MLIVFFDVVYVVKNDWVFFVNWYCFVDGNWINFVLFWIVWVDVNLKYKFMFYLFLVVCCNRDWMDVDIVIEICLLEV